MDPAENSGTSMLKRVLITGGAGFIGSHLAEALLRNGLRAKGDARVVLVDTLDASPSRERKHGNLIDVRAAGEFNLHDVDVCDLARLRAVFRREQPEIVVHLAARAGVRESIAYPQAYEQTNVGGTLNLLELCREFRAERMILASSSSVYGATSRVPFSEDDVELRPLSPYAATKLGAELHCAAYAQVHGLPVIALRLFDVYGPRQRPDQVVSKFTAAIEAGEPVQIFGDGSSSRDYTWIGDAVAGFLAAMRMEIATRPAHERAAETPGSLVLSESAGEESTYRVYNLASAAPVKLTELLDQLEQVMGRNAKREFLPAQAGDLPLTWANISKARRALNFRPAMPLEDGLRRFVAWYRGQHAPAGPNAPIELPPSRKSATGGA